METLLIQPIELTEYTPIGGNVDTDKYLPVILDVQLTVIEPLLGVTLYNKIVEDYKNNDLAGEYEILYSQYLKPILRHQVAAEYTLIGAYTVANGGIFKHKSENSDPATTKEITFLSEAQRNKAQTYIDRAERWLDNSSIAEYKRKGCSNNFNIASGWDLRR